MQHFIVISKLLQVTSEKFLSSFSGVLKLEELTSYSNGDENPPCAVWESMIGLFVIYLL